MTDICGAGGRVQIKESTGEALYAAAHFESTRKRRGAFRATRAMAPQQTKFALRAPSGPVYAITRWNVSAAMLTRWAAQASANRAPLLEARGTLADSPRCFLPNTDS
jgi:acyl-CoA reductase-like NAD-dependent aldehyde dehydrogenase